MSLKDKIINIIKKYDNIFVFTYFIICLSVYVYALKLSINDELWNFSFIYKMANGYEIYKDLNVIITPLFHYIGEIVMQILGKSFLTFRIYNLLIFSTLYTIIYIFLKKMKVKKIYSFSMVLGLSMFINDIISAGANYNILAVLFVFCGIYLEIDTKESIKKNIIKGIILFLIFMTKQNIFVLYAVSLIIVYITKILQKKETIKNIIKKIIIIGTTFMVPLILFIAYLQINNILYDFISYCFLGIGEFSKFNKNISIISIGFLVIGIIGIIISIILIKLKKVDEQICSLNFILLPFEVFMILIAYPIVNIYHIKLGIIISLVVLSYNIYSLIVIEILDENKVEKIVKVCIVLITIYFIGYNLYYLNKYVKYINSEQTVNISPYNNIIIEDDMRNKINNICNYIEENRKKGIDVKIISNEATLYMNILNENNKNMDLPNMGNFGIKGEDGLINEVCELELGTKILISKEEEVQESKKLKDYIMNNYIKIDEIEDFYVYER